MCSCYASVIDADLRFVPFLVVHAYWLATDPVTVYHALGFYYDHPTCGQNSAPPHH